MCQVEFAGLGGIVASIKLHGGIARVGLAALLTLMLAQASGDVSAAAIVAPQSDGSVVVRSEAGDAVTVPADCAAALTGVLSGTSDPATVQAILAEVVAEFAAEDGALANAIALLALTMVPEELGDAVLAGARQGNPAAFQALVAAAGPAPAPRSGGLANLVSVGGVGGGGTQEPPRSASEAE